MASTGVEEISDDDLAIATDGVLVTEGACVRVPSNHDASSVAVGSQSSNSGATISQPVNAISAPRYVAN